jgi:NAD(P)-dependent dehydrogenase (short-subunit alcohol dehydrogenase family)
MPSRNTKHPVPNGQGVLITGCSSGIGHATAIHLAQHGFIVFATVRKEADAENLHSLNDPNLIPVCPLDLTRLEQIPSAVETVQAELKRRGQPGLYALVNNAGGGEVAPIELMNLDRFRIELQAGGRIVWIVTPATIPTPYVTSIHACDFAVNAIARTLDIELKSWGIPNIMIRCGGIKTATGLKTTAALEASLQSWPHERSALYERALHQWGQDMVEFDKKRTEPEEVAKVVLKALSADRPKRRYSVGHMAGAAAFLESLPQSLADSILRARF